MHVDASRKEGGQYEIEKYSQQIKDNPENWEAYINRSFARIATLWEDEKVARFAEECGLDSTNSVLHIGMEQPSIVAEKVVRKRRPLECFFTGMGQNRDIDTVCGSALPILQAAIDDLDKLPEAWSDAVVITAENTGYPINADKQWNLDYADAQMIKAICWELMSILELARGYSPYSAGKGPDGINRKALAAARDYYVNGVRMLSAFRVAQEKRDHTKYNLFMIQPLEATNIRDYEQSLLDLPYWTAEVDLETVSLFCFNHTYTIDPGLDEEARIAREKRIEERKAESERKKAMLRGKKLYMSLRSLFAGEVSVEKGTFPDVIRDHLMLEKSWGLTDPTCGGTFPELDRKTLGEYVEIFDRSLPDYDKDDTAVKYHAVVYTLPKGAENNPEENPATYMTDQCPIVLKDPTLKGYPFARWSNDGVIPVGSNQPMKFTASFDNTWKYVTADGTESEHTDCVIVTADTATFEDGQWYGVTGTVACGPITVNGEAHLILRDGASLTVTSTDMHCAALSVGTNATLTIYGQKNGTGLLTASGGAYAPGIGGDHTGGGHTGAGCGSVVIHGGTVKSSGGTNAAGMGGCYKNDGGSVTITGGRITAVAKNGVGSDIGNGSLFQTDCTVSISGGVFARPLVDTWCVDGKIPVFNSDPATSGDYPWTVDAGWKVTVGDHPHLVVACTFGDGSVTNVVPGVSFGVPQGTENVKVIFTAEPTWEVVGDAVVDLGTVSGDIVFGEESGYLVPGVQYAPVPYVGADGETRTKTGDAFAVVTAETRTLTSGWYVVLDDVVIGSKKEAANLTVEGNVHLILCDGASLTVTNVPNQAAAVSVGGGAALTIYGQTENTGRLEVRGDAYAAGIGGVYKGDCGAIAIHGGTVKAQGGSYGAGIGGGTSGKGGLVTITGGRIYSTAGVDGDPDIGDGRSAATPCEVSISGGIFARALKDAWLAPECKVVANEDAATKDAYPQAVVPRQCLVTIGEHPHLTAAWTSGDGAVTNAIEGTSFRVRWGALKIIFTADAGYVLEGNAAFEVEFGDEDEVDIADAVPKATRWNAVVNVASVKQRWPWNGKIDVDYALSNTAAGEYYRLITAVTVGGATQIVTNELGQVTDGNYSVMVDCAALFGEGVLAPAAVTLAVVACADDLLTIDLPFDSGDTLAYSYEGGEPINIDLGGQSSPITFQFRRNGHYDFYSNGVVTVTRDVSGLGTTMTEPNWAANVLNFMLDTQVERTFDLSAGLVSTNLTYSGTGWNETGAGTSATITFERGGQKTTLASGLTGTGEAAWSPSANGTFTWAHISGAATETATITVVNLPMVTITVGDLAAKHLTGKVVWNGSETSVSGQSFELPKGGKDAKLVLTAEEGYAVPSSQVMEIGLEGYLATGEPVSIVADIPTAVAFGVRLLGVTNRYPWNGKIDVVASVFGLDTTKCYQLVTTLTHGSTTKRVGRELDPSRDAIYTNTVDCAALFGTNVVGDVSVKLSLERCAAEQKIEIEKKFYLSGPFLILDLGGEDGKGAFTSAIYKTTAHLPNGAWSLEDGWANEYKTRYLVMRQVKAGVAYPCEPGSEGMVTKMMTPTNDYWIGVHQVTEAQYDRVMNEGGSTSTNATPKNGISWDAIRGGAGILGLPRGFMLALSNKTELAGFDLPTEAQWEIAARAGSREKYGSYIDTKGMAETATENNVTNISWCSAWYPTFLLEKPKEVGLLRPNLWGLYDTAGNVWEWCRDGSGSFNREDVETPATGDSSGICVCRGGYYNDFSYSCCPSYRFDYSTGSSYNNLGFRLARICESEDSLFVSAANTAEIFVDEGQTFAYAIDGGELRVTEIVGPALLAFSANRNAIYTFYGITEDGAVSILGEPVIVTDAGGEKVAEASEGAVAVDTCEVKEIDGSVGAVTIDLTYSGDNWGKTARGAVEIAFVYNGGTAKTFATGLQGEGTVTWYPKISGTYVFTHAVAGVTESATFHAVGFPGSADNPWEVGAGDAAAVKAYVRDGYLYFAGVGEVVAFTDEAPWKEYEQLIFPLTGAVLPRTVTVPSSVLSMLPISVKGAQPAGAISGDFERIEIMGDEALLTVGVYTNGELTATSGWGRVQVEKADVVDGAAVLTVPAAADKGFFTLQHKENTK